MKPEHWQLLGECVDHDLNVAPKLLKAVNETSSGFVKSWLFYFAIKGRINGLKRDVNGMRMGEPPTERKEESTWITPEIPDLR